jgi:sugar transferase (PEP-CTERM system associated)
MARIAASKISSVTVLLMFLDALFVIFGLLLAIALRFRQSPIEYLRGPHVIARFAFVIVVCEVALYYSKLYDRLEFSNGFKIFTGLLRALGSASLVLGIVYYLDDTVSLGRGIAAMSAPTVFALLLVSRIVVGSTSLFLYGPRRVLVVGTGPTGISAVREILVRPELNLKVEGFLDERGENIGKSLVNPGIIGSLRDVESIALGRGVHQVIISLLERRGRMPVSELLHLKFAGVDVEDAHSFIERTTGRIHLEDLSPSWLILSSGFRKSAFSYAVKRSFDILVALIVFLLTLPVMISVAATVWLDTGSPILFRQARTGLRGRTFQMLKFRSMYQNAEKDGPVWAVSNDNRVTTVGRFLRRFRLDELPQIWNVLRGEMSLVGPRPERPEFCLLLEQQIPFFSLRHSVRPGITGWAQVRYQYGASVEEAQVKLEYDFFYIKNLSVALDLAILFETAKVMIYGRGAQ